MNPAAWLIALALLGVPASVGAQSGDAPEWSLKSWPGRATILAAREIGKTMVVLRTIECTNGERNVTSRRFLLPGERNSADVQPCGAYCRMHLSQTLPQGALIPDRFIEDKLPIGALRQTLLAELATEIAAEPWRERDETRLQLLLQMADTCRLRLPATVGQAHWRPVAPSAVASPLGQPPNPPILYALPPRSRAYQPVTKPTSPGAITEPLILRVTGEVLKGEASVSLRDAAGHALSPEAVLSASDGLVGLYFELGAKMPPVSVAVRNNDEAAGEGSFLVRRIDVAAKSQLDRQDLVDLKAALSGQAMGKAHMKIPQPRPTRPGARPNQGGR